MSSSSGTSRRADQDSERNFPPIRWPHPEPVVLVLLFVWVLALLLAVFVPALIVPPGADGAETSDVWLAFSCTVVGAVIMTVVGLLLYRRTREPIAAAFAVVPSFTVLVGGVIVVATKITGVI